MHVFWEQSKRWQRERVPAWWWLFLVYIVKWTNGRHNSFAVNEKDWSATFLIMNLPQVYSVRTAVEWKLPWWLRNQLRCLRLRIWEIFDGRNCKCFSVPQHGQIHVAWVFLCEWLSFRKGQLQSDHVTTSRMNSHELWPFTFVNLMICRTCNYLFIRKILRWCCVNLYASAVHEHVCECASELASCNLHWKCCTYFNQQVGLYIFGRLF